MKTKTTYIMNIKLTTQLKKLRKNNQMKCFILCFSLYTIPNDKSKEKKVKLLFAENCILFLWYLVKETLNVY